MNDFTTYQQHKDEHQNDRANALLREIPTTIALALAGFGLAWGRKYQRLLPDDFSHPDFRDLSFSFGYYYGRFYVYFNFTEKGNKFPSSVGRYRLLDRDDRFDVIWLQTKVVEFIKIMNVQIRQDNMIAECQCPFHKKTQYESYLDCSLIEGKWWCVQCIEVVNFSKSEYFLTSLIEAPLDTNATNERAKMTTKLRFAILERDNFTCRACGRNPREDKIKLHVDHIVAVAKGGKSIPENLHTLCQNCNLAKSDKSVKQMELWPVSA